MCNARLFNGNHEICRFAKCRHCRLILQCNVTEATLKQQVLQFSSDDRRAADSNCKIIFENQSTTNFYTKTKIIFNIVGYCIQCKNKMNTYMQYFYLLNESNQIKMKNNY